MKQVLYFHIGLSSFVEKDVAILKEEFELSIFHFQVKNKKQVPFSFFKQFFFILKNFFKSDIFVIQFGGYQSLIPCLFSKLFKKKKSVIILGGTDCVSLPSIKYGNFSKKLLTYATEISLKTASLLLPVDESLIKYKYEYQDNDFPYQGYQYFIKNIQTPNKVIYNGYDGELWKCTKVKEPLSFITVGANLGSRFGFQLKGIDLIFEVAPNFPDCKFYIVGGNSIKNKVIPSNIILLNPVPNESLAEFISSKQYYLQLSMSEGFPNALCEAMLCECIPIVSSVGAMPKIVGLEGYILEKKSLLELKSIIFKAIGNTSKHDTNKVRDRIINNFQLSLRKNELLKIINSLN